MRPSPQVETQAAGTASGPNTKAKLDYRRLSEIELRDLCQARGIHIEQTWADADTFWIWVCDGERIALGVDTERQAMIDGLRANPNRGAGMKTTDLQTDAWRAPTIPDGETVVYDEPGRVLVLKPASNHDVCFRAYHFRVTKWHGSAILHVKHGGGQESFRLSCAMLHALAIMDSVARYFTLHAIMDAHHNGAKEAEGRTAQRYIDAHANGRLKRRKVRGSQAVKVWIASA